MSQQDLTNPSIAGLNGNGKQTNRACNHCHKAHMTCDNNRPCERCVQRGLDLTCEDAPRKRKKYLADVPLKALGYQEMETLVSGTPVSSVQGAVGESQFQSPNGSDFTTPGSFSQVKQEMSPVNLGTLPPPFNNGIDHQAPTDHFTHLPQPITQPATTTIPDYSAHRPPPQARPTRTNFLSSAADLEYSTLSSILQDNFGHGHSTSNEGTPQSMNNLSPGHSPNTNINNNGVNVGRNIPAIGNTNHDLNYYSKPQISPYLSGSSQTSSPHEYNRNKSINSQIYDNPRYPKCDESINQYFLGPTESDHVLMFPDVITAIESIKMNDPAVFKERNLKLKLSFTIGIVPDDSHYSKLGESQDTEANFKEPEEIYANITKPFSYTVGYHSLIAYLKKRFPREMLVKMAESMAAYRPSFIACTNSLKEGDLIFMEQCFQRTLLTYDNFVRVSGTPTIVWRRTGEIAYVGNEFCILTGWSKQELVGQKKFIVELLDDKSVVEYFQLFLRIAFGDFLGATMTECTLLTPKPDVKIRTGCMWTLKRDVFGIPMMIIGNFLPIV